MYMLTINDKVRLSCCTYTEDNTFENLALSVASAYK